MREVHCFAMSVRLTRMKMNTVGCGFILLKRVHIRMLAVKTTTEWIRFAKIPLPLSSHLVCWILCRTWIYATRAFCAGPRLCLCCALHHCSKIDFLRLSHHAVRSGSRKCLLPLHSVNVMLWQTLLSDTWQGARLPSGLACKCADACACVHVCASFPASLMRRFLRLFVFSQTGGWLCTGDSWEISLRGQGVLKVLPSLTSVLFTESLDLYVDEY